MLKKGDKAPSFSLQNVDGNNIKLEDLRGKKVVLYFYPKDSTPGCTLQANDYTSLIPEFEALNTTVIGVSPDSCESHKKFKEKYNLKIDLLVDSDKEVVKSYFAYGDRSLYGKLVTGIKRSTFIIDENGIIEEALYNVKATGNAKRVLGILEKSSK